MSERIEDVEEFADVQERLANSTMVLTFSMNQQLDQQQRAFQQQTQSNKAITESLRGFKALAEGIMGMGRGLEAVVHTIQSVTFGIDALNRLMRTMAESLLGPLIEGEERTTQYLRSLDEVTASYIRGTNAQQQLNDFMANTEKLTNELSVSFNQLNGPTQDLQQTLASMIEPGKTKKFIDNLNKVFGVEDKQNKSVKEAGKMMASMGKDKVLKTIKSMTGMLKQMVKAQVQAAAMEPFMNMLSGILKPLKALTSILNVVLIPLQPFIMMLEIVGKVLEAAMAPMQEEIWEALIPVIDDLMEMLPELTAQVEKWIKDGKLTQMINGMVAVFNSLTKALVSGDLFGLLFNLSVIIANLAVVIAQPQFLSGLTTMLTIITKVGGIILDLFMPVLGWLAGLDVGTIQNLFIAFAVMFTWLNVFSFFASIPGGALIGAGIATVVAAGVGIGLASLMNMADGGYVTGPTPAMIGEGADNEHVIPDTKFDTAFSNLEDKFDTLIAISAARFRQEEDRIR